MTLPARASSRLTDRILVAGGSDRTLGLLRLAVIRSDDVVLIAATPDPAVRRFADRFAIEVIARPAREDDINEVAAVLIAIGDAQAENSLVRAARRHRVPVHVADRTLVSDFDMLEFLEQRTPAVLAA
jgi:uroporphyrin-III C-methyltransferase / precorrin-2 dehydrogenase / sirohydrochlorin ferrochelatase